MIDYGRETLHGLQVTPLLQIDFVICCGKQRLEQNSEWEANELRILKLGFFVLESRQICGLWMLLLSSSASHSLSFFYFPHCLHYVKILTFRECSVYSTVSTFNAQGYTCVSHTHLFIFFPLFLSDIYLFFS